jgi:hypothetical protein
VVGGGAQLEALTVTTALPVELGLAIEVAVTVALKGFELQPEGAA